MKNRVDSRKEKRYITREDLLHGSEWCLVALAVFKTVVGHGCMVEVGSIPTPSVLAKLICRIREGRALRLGCYSGAQFHF